MTPISPTGIEELRGLVAKASRLLSLSKKATAGPWRKFTSAFGNDTVAIMKGDAPCYDDSGYRIARWPEIIGWQGFDGSDTSETKRHSDARFLVAAVNFVRDGLPHLLAGLLALADENAGLRAEVEAKDARIARLEAIVGDIVASTTVGRPGSMALRSRYGSYPATLYLRARALHESARS